MEKRAETPERWSTAGEERSDRVNRATNIVPHPCDVVGERPDLLALYVAV